tara:strand:+ start:45 stop:341 length:297 start_codon:yes stop_codon:yes gene_type:complete
MRTTESKLRRIIRNVISEATDYSEYEGRPRQDFGKPTLKALNDDQVLPYTHDQMLDHLIDDCDEEGCNASEMQIIQVIEAHASRFYGDVLEDLKRNYR